MIIRDPEHIKRWISKIQPYFEDYDEEEILKLSLSYTLQSLRNGENIKRFSWNDKCV